MDNPKGPVKSFGKQDPMEAIYALNVGDFLAEDFISDDLLSKISDTLASDPEKLKRQLDEMIQIYSIDKTLGILGFKSDEGFILYDSIASTLAKMFQVEACHLFQCVHRDTGEEYLSLTGTSRDLTNQNRWKIGIEVTGPETDLLSRVYHESETLVLTDLEETPGWHPLQKLGQEWVKTLIASPMAEGKKRIGLLLFESYEKRAFSPELITLAEAIGRLFVTAIRLQQLVAKAHLEIGKRQADLAELRNLRAQMTESIADLGAHQQEFVESLGAAIDARQQFTRGHSRHVAQIAKAIAETLDLNEKTVDLVYYAGLLGAIGKMNIPRQVMAKHDRLTREEWENLRNHPNVGVALLVQINFLSEVVPYVHYQHERWDGSGFPEGRRTRDIPLGSRILAVADAYRAMTADRPYREKALTHAETLRLLQEEAGAKWDPAVVETLARLSPESFE